MNELCPNTYEYMHRDSQSKYNTKLIKSKKRSNIAIFNVRSYEETLKFQDWIFQQTYSNPSSKDKRYESKESRFARKDLFNSYAKKKANNSEEIFKEYLKQKNIYRRVQRRELFNKK